ncbi:MAG: hypothetical protein ABIF77_10735 [bacterium]
MPSKRTVSLTGRVTQFYLSAGLSAGLSAVLSGILAVLLCGCEEIKVEKRGVSPDGGATSITHPDERHLCGLVQLTSSGSNRQGSLDATNKRLVWLCRPDSSSYYQIQIKTVATEAVQVVAGGNLYRGVVFAPDGRSLLYAEAPRRLDSDRADRQSTEVLEQAAGRYTPPITDPRDWQFDPGFDLVSNGCDGAHPLALTTRPGFDAEASFGWDGQEILFTSLVHHSSRLMLMAAGGGDPVPVLSFPGYAGGARLAPSGHRIVFHGARRDGRPGSAIYICNRDGSELQVVADSGIYNLSPSWHPEENHIIYSSNGVEHDFELFLVSTDGTSPERLTHSPGFDAFPVFSRDGRLLIWTGQRGAAGTNRTQLFQATWIP